MRFRTKQLVGVAIGLIAIAALTTLAQSRAGQRELRALGIVGRPAAFTELAFDDPAKLPNTLHRRRGAALISFTIANHGVRPASYDWKIVVSGGTPRVARSGTAHVGAGQAVRVLAVVWLRCTVRTRVNVLLSSGESIGFWATCTGRAPVRRR